MTDLQAPKLDQRIYEIRWHGRGGQGAISSAQILAEAAFYQGFKGVAAAPFFGAERRGAPVTASTRFSHEQLRVYSQIERPDIAIVLEEALIETGHALAGLKTGGWLIVNSPKTPAELAVEGDFLVATADALGVAQRLGLLVAGNAIVNTAMLGAFVRATGLVSLDCIRRALESRFPPGAAQLNAEASRLTYEATILKEGKD
ncbi:MAG: 2-oxoacid:acceptor oxidoreductase family protein [Dehalococcoidia bacterium]|nr:2-oxoacid:acceptor oxidoreductase family protein [Dehalococcoidia bacterium]